MRKLISFMHMSLDGYVAGPNGEMNWITINEELFDHIGKRIHSGDTAMYGRVTYQMMEGYWPTAGNKPNASKHDIEHARWYAGIRKVVLSQTLKPNAEPNSLIVSGNLQEHLTSLKSEKGETIYVFGSPSATHALLNENLIDGFWLFLNPVILGQGIPLFKNIHRQTNLKLLSSHVFNCGVTELYYETKA